MKKIFLAGAALILMTAAPAFATDSNVTQLNSASVGLNLSSTATASGTGAQATTGPISATVGIEQYNTALGGCGCDGDTDQTNGAAVTGTITTRAEATGGLFGGGRATTGSVTANVGIRQKNFSWRH